MSGTAADLILIGGKVRTPAQPSGFAQAIAIGGGLIRAVGSDADIRDLAGPRTRVIGLPLWACSDPQMQELTIPFVGPERVSWQYQIGGLARRGTRLAFGSDWPVSSADPLQDRWCTAMS